MPNRMLNYGIEIIRNAQKDMKTNKGNSKYPEVFLIVLYTGSMKWTAKLEYKQISDNVIEYKENGINAKYTVVDIHNYSKEELIKENNMIKNVMAIGKSKKAEEVKEIVEYLIENTKDKEEQIKLKRIVKYILPKILNQKDVEVLLKKMKKEENDMFGMLEENLEKERREMRKEARRQGLAEGRAEGRAKGRAEGRANGIKETKIELIRNMIKEKIPMETIMRITNFTKEELDEIQI